MIIVKFCRGPKSEYIGWAEYENGHYFSSGRTLDILMKNIKLALYQKKRISSRSVILDSKPSEQSDCPVQYMSNMFRGKHWKHAEVEAEEPAERFDYYEQVTVNGVLEIYGVRKVKVAEYKLKETVDETI